MVTTKDEKAPRQDPTLQGGDDKVENGEHGTFPSPKEVHGVERIEPIPIFLSDDVVLVPCE